MKKDADSSLLASLGLRLDGGWIDALADDLAAQPQLLEWVQHLLRSRSRDGQDWAEAQDWVASIAAAAHLPDLSIPQGRAIAKPGSDAFCEVLMDAAPNAGWRAECECLTDKIGREPVIAAVGRWIQAATRSRIGLLNRPGPARDALWALLWSTLPLKSDLLVERLRQFATWAVLKRVHPANTAGAALAAIETEAAAAALRLIEQSARRPSQKNRFAGLAEHIERRLNLSPDQTAERFIPTCDFPPGGVRSETFGNAAVELRIDGNDVVTTWTNDKGKVVRTAPAATKRTHGQAIKDLSASAKDAEKTLAAQRDRLDRLMALPRTWSFADWRINYLDHPLVGMLARRLIWMIDGAAVTFDASGSPHAIDGESLSIRHDAPIALWHPIHQPADNVLAWRHRLASLEIIQPFKQAHREVYLLTDAERTTRVYSNRFAAHVIRQHPFKAIGLARGWDISLRLIYENSDPPPATRRLPAFGLRAEFWTQGVRSEHRAETTNAGSFLYLATDQVRFHPLEACPGAEPLPLDTIPPLAFSEVLRDVDLFVGVCSVGNDPTWEDGGPGGRFREYWHAYSVGELTASASTRKTVLADLLPRLRLKDRAQLTERFLVIRGRLRTYKIHLGSANILMSPNDQYLCIVPGHKTSGDARLFLPFDGDQTLAVILSKAFMLADDDRITDPTILRQIQSP